MPCSSGTASTEPPGLEALPVLNSPKWGLGLQAHYSSLALLSWFPAFIQELPPSPHRRREIQ